MNETKLLRRPLKETDIVGEEDEIELGPKNYICAGWKQAAGLYLGTKNNMCGGTW